MKWSAPKLKLCARWALLVITIGALSGCGAVRNVANRGVGLVEGISGRNLYKGNDIPYIPSIPQ